ncbi:MAG: hypothetical protein ACJ8MR_13835 [Povalibacter sp.]
MRRVAVTLSFIQLTGLCACTTPESLATPAANEQAARVLNPTAESRAELLEAVNSALSSSAVTVADDALTDSNILIIERTPARDASGVRLSGRDFDRPQHFELRLSGSQCVLIHQESQRRFPLKQVKCEAFSAKPAS